jgi:lipopolysaccharide transport system ATP-binding protein
MSEPIIDIRGVSKQYLIGARERTGRTFREALTDVFAAPVRNFRNLRRLGKAGDERPDTIWALKDVSLRVMPGEVVGIIGRNGAGKSTLLKILSRITKPTSGEIRLFGRVASLLEVGTGFHPELTGRENIYLNGTILGMRKREIDRKFGEIVAFSEIEKFLDTPVKRYSSGMYVRLAFAVAAHLEPEILLVDEVLAVGDIAFQKKCLGKMDNVAKEGRTVLFVSHNMTALTHLCSSAYLLEQGRLVKSGAAGEVIDHYMQNAFLDTDVPLSDITNREGDKRMRFTGILIRDSQGNPLRSVCSGQDVTISLGYASEGDAPLHNVSTAIGFHGHAGQFLFFCSNEVTGTHFETIPSKGSIDCRIPRFPLPPGEYGFNFHCSVNGIMSDWVKDNIKLIVAEGDFFGSGKLPPTTHKGTLIDHSWSVGDASGHAKQGE